MIIYTDVSKKHTQREKQTSKRLTLAINNEGQDKDDIYKMI